MVLVRDCFFYGCLSVLARPVPYQSATGSSWANQLASFSQFVMSRLYEVLDHLGPVRCEPSHNLVAHQTGLSVHTDQLTLSFVGANIPWELKPHERYG